MQGQNVRDAGESSRSGEDDVRRIPWRVEMQNVCVAQELTSSESEAVRTARRQVGELDEAWIRVGSPPRSRRVRCGGREYRYLSTAAGDRLSVIDDEANDAAFG